MIRINDPNIIVIVFGEHALNTLGQIRCFGEMGKNVTSLKLFATYGKEKDTHNPAKHRFFYLTLQQHLPNKKRHDLQ